MIEKREKFDRENITVISVHFWVPKKHKLDKQNNNCYFKTKKINIQHI